MTRRGRLEQFLRGRATRVFLFAALALWLCGCREKPRAAAAQPSAQNAPAAALAATDERAEAIAFVRQYYAWYDAKNAELERNPHAEDPGFLTVKLNPPVLAPELLRALRADYEAQAQADEIVGIDFDPFSASQDSCLHHRVADTLQPKDGGWLIDVYNNGPQCFDNNQLALTAEARKIDGHWSFVNFHYLWKIKGRKEKGDLVSILAESAKDRAAARATENKK